MDKQYRHDFERLLNVAAPWHVHSVSVDESKQTIDVELNYQLEKSRFSFISKNSASNSSSEEMIKGRWRHINIGGYACYISADVPVYSSTPGISRTSVSQPSFVGEAGRRYTHQLRQQVALCAERGFDRQTICSTYHIDESIVETILIDFDKTAASDRVLAYLPTESDNIWRNILLDKFLVKTQMLPLKLLLSKLKLASITSDNIDKLNTSIHELRQFFIAHAASLEAECAQLCGLSLQKQAVAERRKAASRLVLPALKSSVWIHLLSGKINLKSNNMSLNLLLVRQRSAFQNSDSNETKVRAISALREFFKKNARSLKQELVTINRLIQQPAAKNKVVLPDPQHSIWQNILKDDAFIPSNHMAYKLLLSKLRSTLLMNSTEPGIQLTAAKRVRDFYAQNQRTMQQELKMVLKQSNAI